MEAVFLAGNFLRWKPPIPELDTRDVVTACAPLVLHKEPQVAEQAAWAMVHATDGENSRIELALSCLPLPPLRAALSDLQPDSPLVHPMLRVVGNVVTGTEEQTQLVVDAG
eukprot:gene12431-15859_t